MRVRAAAAGLVAVAMIAAGAWLSVLNDVRATGSCETQTAGVNEYELAVYHEINRARADEGLPTLALSPGLSRAAAWKSEDTSAAPPNLSHTDSLGRGPTARARDCGYPHGAGEIIAWGSFLNAQHLVSEWMNSPGHRANILSEHFSAMGVGEAGSRTRWTVKFGQVDDSGSVSEAPPPVQPTPSATATPTLTAIPTPTPSPTPSPTPAPTATPAPMRAGVTVELSKGMNLAGYLGPSHPVDIALESVWGSVEWVYSWDATTGGWQRYLPGAPGWVNTLVALRTGDAYFVSVAAPVDWQQ